MDKKFTLRSYLPAKSILVVNILLSTLFRLTAQAPEGIGYQAVVRNSTGQIIQNTPVGIQFTIHDSTASGNIIFVQRDTVIPNLFGLINVVIGGGTIVQGSFTGINWAHGFKFLQVGIDDAGGINYTDMGTSQMLSVPYALYAATSGNNLAGPTGPQGSKGNTGATGLQGPTGLQGATGASASADTIWKKNGNNIYNTNTGNVGILTNTPTAPLTVNGFSMLGMDAPPVKMKEFTGTMPGHGGDSATFNVGISDSQIRGINVLVQDPVNGLLSPVLSLLNQQYSYTLKSSVFTLHTTLLNSAEVLNKAYTVLITYRE